MTKALPPIVLAATLLVLPVPASAAGDWRWPVAGEIITPFRNGADPYAAGQHRGIDIGAAVGAPVLAATAGTVRFAGVAGSSGLTVSVRTADGAFDTAYLHLASADVREGAFVAAGDRLGAVGTSGRRSAEAPHLHFGVRVAGTRHAYRDPLEFLTPLAPPGEPGLPPGAPAPAPVRHAPARPPRRVFVARPLPIGRRVPAGRRLPAGRQVPVAGPKGAPLPVPAPARRAPAPAFGQRSPHPQAAPRRALSEPLPAGPASEPKLPAPAAVDSARPSQAAEPRAGGEPNLGWALACLGLLLAAACLATGSRGDERGGARRGARGPRVRARLAALLRPLGGRG